MVWRAAAIMYNFRTSKAARPSTGPLQKQWALHHSFWKATMFALQVPCLLHAEAHDVLFCFLGHFVADWHLPHHAKYHANTWCIAFPCSQGQDVQRGTFAHRHCVVKDQNTGQDYCCLAACGKPSRSCLWRVSVLNVIIECRKNMQTLQSDHVSWIHILYRYCLGFLNNLDLGPQDNSDWLYNIVQFWSDHDGKLQVLTLGGGERKQLDWVFQNGAIVCNRSLIEFLQWDSG